jgi:hypothetical protein
MSSYAHLVESASTLEPDDIDNLITALGRLRDEKLKENEPAEQFDDIIRHLEHEFPYTGDLQGCDLVPFLFTLAEFGFIIRCESCGSSRQVYVATLYKVGDPHDEKPRHVIGVTRSNDPHHCFDADDVCEAGFRILAHASVENMIRLDPMNLFQDRGRCQLSGQYKLSLGEAHEWPQAYRFRFSLNGEIRDVNSPYRVPDIARAICLAENLGSDFQAEDPDDLELLEVRNCRIQHDPNDRFAWWEPTDVIWKAED